MPNFPVVPSRMALLNIDVQNCFVESCGPDGLAVVAQVNRLAQVCRAAGMAVFHFRHTLPTGFELGVLGEILPALKNGILHPDAESAAFHPDLVCKPSDILMQKPHYGAFHDTGLELHLRRRGIDTIIITGIETNVCCETTAREAMVRDFRVFFLSDATATGGIRGLARADIQRVSLATLGACFAQVLTVDEMIQKIQDAPTTRDIEVRTG